MDHRRKRMKIMTNLKKAVFWFIVVALVAGALVTVLFLMNPKKQDKSNETLLAGTDYSGYEELIAQAIDVLNNFDGNYPKEEPFSSVIYQNWDYETLGYLIKDMDGNGIDELIFGANTDGWDEGSWDGIIYDVYTIENGEVIHVLDG